MNDPLEAKWLGECFDYVLAKGANVGKIWARFQGGEIFKKTHGLIQINDGVHCR